MFLRTLFINNKTHRHLLLIVKQIPTSFKALNILVFKSTLLSEKRKNNNKIVHTITDPLLIQHRSRHHYKKLHEKPGTTGPR
jgi:hypothetical protein